jgi:hypothetical protein
MLAVDKGPLVIPFVWAGFGVFNERVVPIVVVRYDTSPRGEGVATLVGQGAILTLVPVQQATAPTPITLIGVLSFRLGWVGVGSHRSWEGQPRSFELVWEVGSES